MKSVNHIMSILKSEPVVCNILLLLLLMTLTSGFSEKGMAQNTDSIPLAKLNMNKGELQNNGSGSNIYEPLEFTVRRFEANPIIHREMHGMIGDDNINGPSLIRVPDWVEDPLGKYYLYFAHHHGRYIRMAYADRLEGPWIIYQGGVFPVEATPVYEHDRPRDHVASPDVHVDHDKQVFRMYYHTNTPPRGTGGQRTFAAVSANGLHFEALDEPLGYFYFRVFEHDDWYYAMAKSEGGRLYRSRYSLVNFKEREGPTFLSRSLRHLAVWKHKGILYVFYTNVGDEPEHILVTHVKNLDDSWYDWEFAEPESLLKPEKDYEGVHQPIKPSEGGGQYNFVHALHDPYIFEDDDGRVYMLYSTAGEWAIAIAELIF